MKENGGEMVEKMDFGFFCGKIWKNRGKWWPAVGGGWWRKAGGGTVGGGEMMGGGGFWILGSLEVERRRKEGGEVCTGWGKMRGGRTVT
jgi:hypothetical protein